MAFNKQTNDELAALEEKERKQQAILDRAHEMIDRTRYFRTQAAVFRQQEDLKFEEKERARELEEQKREDELMWEAQMDRVRRFLQEHPAHDTKPSWNISRQLKAPKPSPVARGKEYAAKLLSAPRKLRSKPFFNVRRELGPYAQPKPKPKVKKLSLHERLNNAPLTQWDTILELEMSGTNDSIRSKSKIRQNITLASKSASRPSRLSKSSYSRRSAGRATSYNGRSRVFSSNIRSQTRQVNTAPVLGLSHFSRPQIQKKLQTAISKQDPLSQRSIRSQEQRILYGLPSPVPSTSKQWNGNPVSAGPFGKNPQVNISSDRLVTYGSRRTRRIVTHTAKMPRSQPSTMSYIDWIETVYEIDDDIPGAGGSSTVQSLVGANDYEADADSVVAQIDTEVESVTSVLSDTIVPSNTQRNVQETPERMSPALKEMITDICLNLYALGQDMEHPSQHITNFADYHKGLALIRATDNPDRNGKKEEYVLPVQTKPTPSETYYYGFPYYTKSGAIVDSKTSLQSYVYTSPAPKNQFRMSVNPENPWDSDVGGTSKNDSNQASTSKVARRSRK